MPIPPTQTGTSPTDPLFQRILEWILSAGGGALLMLVAFRTRLALMNVEIKAAKAKAEAADALARSLAATLEGLLDRRMEAFGQQITRDITRELDGVKELIGRLDRRSYETLKVVVDIARATGTDKRLGNSLLRMLGDEPPRHDDDDEEPRK